MLLLFFTFSMAAKINVGGSCRIFADFTESTMDSVLMDFFFAYYSRRRTLLAKALYFYDNFHLFSSLWQMQINFGRPCQIETRSSHEIERLGDRKRFDRMMLLLECNVCDWNGSSRCEPIVNFHTANDGVLLKCQWNGERVLLMEKSSMIEPWKLICTGEFHEAFLWKTKAIFKSWDIFHLFSTFSVCTRMKKKIEDLNMIAWAFLMVCFACK